MAPIPPKSTSRNLHVTQPEIETNLIEFLVALGQHISEAGASGVLIRLKVEHECDGRAGPEVREVDDGLIRARVMTKLCYFGFLDRYLLSYFRLEVLEAVDDVTFHLKWNFIPRGYQPRL